MGRLATVDRLLKFGIQVPPSCVFCDSADETLDHLLFNCTITRALWTRLLNWLGIQRTIGTWQEEVNWVCTWAKRRTEKGAIISVIFAMLVATIWRERNLLRFHNGYFQVDRICREIAIHIHIKGQHNRKWQQELLVLTNP
ncbi:uncharacterized protein LOC132639602 [Lycium barbarum]|uniref:uncharacterized protein LOC132639602 n=1 Tax=Lycium barbarum TaxID=112863 RepID=UPI00293E6D6D|nr:uncharacterized protein LOC132639602 [Lycium barbarum]